MKFTKIPETAFQNLQLNAGVLLSGFTPATGEVDTESILGATTGGVKFSATPSFVDMGDGVDNCPTNMKELKKIDGWDINMSGTFITVNTEVAKALIAGADIDPEDATKIVPRNEILDTDFSDIWWVGDYSDMNGKANGGFVAIHMMDVLSTGGFQVQSGNKDKGQFPFAYTAHFSSAAQDVVPFEVYIKAGTVEPAV